MVRSASAICEAFINQVLVARDFSADLPAKGQWTRIPLTPVKSIGAVEALAPDGTTTVLASGATKGSSLARTAAALDTRPPAENFARNRDFPLEGS